MKWGDQPRGAIPQVLYTCVLYIHASVPTINPSYVIAHHDLPLIKMVNDAAMVCKRTRAGGVVSGVCVHVVRCVAIVSVWSVMLAIVWTELVVWSIPLGEYVACDLNTHRLSRG